MSVGESLHPIDNVQAALDAYFADELMDENFTEWKCEREGCQETQRPTLQHKVVDAPPVLCITLKRWESHRTPLLHHVRPDAHISLGGCRYALRSVLIHLGSSPHGGHYITLAHHASNMCDWWLYNDADRRPATLDEIDCTSEAYGERIWLHSPPTVRA